MMIKWIVYAARKATHTGSAHASLLIRCCLLLLLLLLLLLPPLLPLP
jgi:hypothetical protein